MKENIIQTAPARRFNLSTMAPLHRFKLLPSHCSLNALMVAILSTFFLSITLQVHASMILEWRFNETNGSPTVADSSGNGNIGTVTNVTFVPNGGIVGGCAQFAGTSGVDQRIYMNTNGIFPTALTAPYQYPITVSVWAKNNAPGTGNGPQLFSLGANNTSIYHGCRQIGQLDERANGVDNLIGTGAASGTSWNNIVCVWSATNSQAIYVNGVLNASGTVYGVTNPIVQFAVGELYRSLAPAVANPYGGLMEDIAMWTDALSAQQVAAIYGLGYFSAGYASSMSNFLAAFTAGTNIALNRIIWAPTNGLSGSIGAVGGAVATTNAYIVLDNSGDGMETVGATVPPTISSFTVSPSQIFAGDAPTLSWNVVGADSVTINQDIGLVSLTGSTNIVTAVSSNSSSITWMLVAANNYGSATNYATVTILPTPGPLNLVANWGLDESGGTTATNSLGADVTGEFVVGNNVINGVSSPAIPPAWEPTNGYIGGCLFFTTDLTTNMAVVRADLDGVVLTNYPFTLAAWVNTEDVVTRNMTVINLVNSNSANQYYCLQVDQGQARLAARNDVEFDLYGPYVYGSGNYSDWHYIVADFERDNVRNIYVDGSYVATDNTPLGGFVPVNRFSAGAIDRLGGIASPYNGMADEVALFTGTLTANEVSLFYGGMSGLNLNTSEINTLWQAFLQTNSATVHGLVWTYASGLGGSAGSTQGSLASGNASITMDGNGDGMQISTTLPAVTGIIPGNPVTGSSGAQTLTILGANFQPGCTVTLSNVDTSVSTSPAVTFVNSSSLTINAVLTVIPHKWSIVVNNSNGLVSSPYSFTVVTPQRPEISSIGLSSGKVALSGTNGTAGLTYTVLSSTNLALPLSSWTPVTTNVFGPGGSFNWTNAVTPTSPRSFYIIKP